MRTIAGVDGCRAGWICVIEDVETHRVGSHVFADFATLATKLEADVIAVDMPIGFDDARRRECDLAARLMLRGRRASSVFYAPVRPALDASTHREASATARRIEGHGLAIQSFALFPKMVEVDRALREHRELQARVFEVHPEVTFAHWNGSAIQDGKRTEAGFAARRRLVDAAYGPHAYESVRARYTRDTVANDDILDAFAALRTAMRIHRSEAQTLPVNPPRDRYGLPMQMVY